MVQEETDLQKDADGRLDQLNVADGRTFQFFVSPKLEEHTRG